MKDYKINNIKDTLYSFLLVFIFLSICSCTSNNNSASFKNKTMFNKVLSKGYFPRIIHSTDIINVCVFNNPSRKSKVTLSLFFDFLQMEFGFGSTIKYAESFSACPVRTNEYILFHEGNINSQQIKTIWKTILKQKRLRFIDAGNPSKVGWFSVNVSKYNTVRLVTINQMSQLTVNDMQRRALIIQELFQSVFVGLDIPNISNIGSILQETTPLNFNGLSDADKIKKYMQNHPTGLCSLDLWYLILISQYIDRKSGYRETGKYKEIFRKNYKSIKAQALITENKPEYKGLFDPRCSGKNTGINTKIGTDPPY